MKNVNKCVPYYSNLVDFKKLIRLDFNNWSPKQTFIQFISIWPFRTKITRNVSSTIPSATAWKSKPGPSSADFETWKGALKAVFRNDSDGYQKTIQFIQVAISK